MKILQKVFLSMGSAVIMVMLFAIAIAAATFLENDYGLTVARQLIYEAKWFEILILLLGVNLVANIMRHQLWKKGKRLILIFHAALILIYLGAALTRYAGFEGVMHIREGENAGFLLSEGASLGITVRSGGDDVTVKRPVTVSPIMRRRITQPVDLNGRRVEVQVTDGIQGAEKTLVPDDYGPAMVALTLTRRTGAQDVILREQESIDLANVTFAFETESGI